ncbi:MAG TPA: EAL domain-containing protein, partial [Hyphomicrobiales bacterium]|nr:EAL domain-containing protein [Hyphomicrobiales bacterium]
MDDRGHWLGGIGRAIDRIEDAIGRSQELAVLMVYVDDVDRLCASAGHVHAGEILNDFRERLEELAREEDVVAQLSDRKFVLLLGGFRNEGHIQLAAQKIQRLIQESSGARTDEQGLNVTIGIALVAPPYDSAKEVLRSAELALLEGRRSNEPVAFYKTQAADEMVAEWHLAQKFADALEAGNLELYYQPKMDLDSKRIVGAEALIRWHDPELGEISPDVFIGVAEKSGLITELTYFSIQRACRQLNYWKSQAGGLTVAINTTPNTTRDFGIIDVLESATRIWNVDPASIVIEVTENA